MPGLWDRISSGILGPQQNYGGLLDEQAQQAAKHQAMMAMSAQLMQGGGWSPQRTTLGQAVGPAMQAGQAAGIQSIDAALQASLLKAQIEKANKPAAGRTPAAVEEYEYAKANGFKGSFEEWKRVASAQPQSPANIQEYEYFQKLSPEEQKKFLSLQRSPVVPQLGYINQVPTLIDRTGSSAPVPLSTQESEIAALVKKAMAESQAKAQGQVTGEAMGALAKKGINALNVLETLELADPLIDVATGSTTGAAADKVAAFFGQSTTGDQAIAQLKVLQANLMTNMPRMEGPQSDRDVQLYREAAGEIGDANVPRGRKRAAVKMIAAIQEKYAEQAADQTGAQPAGKPKRIRVDAQGNVIGN